jgi:hypothetical protein
MAMIRIRTKSGAVLALSVALALVLAIIGVSFFLLSRILGGHRELCNATDAVAASVARQALRTPGVALTDEEQKNFVECLDSYADRDHGVFPDMKPAIDLMTYNRVAGKAMVIAMNAREQAQYEEGDLATQHAEKAFQQAQAIARRLKTELNNMDNFKQTIADASSGNHINMANLNAHVAINSVSTGYLFGQTADSQKEGEPSNTLVSSRYKSAIENDRFLGRGKIVSFTEDGGNNYLPGYREMWVPQATQLSDGSGLSVMFTPLRNGGQPHCVPTRNFDDSTQGQSKIAHVNDYAVPNAFKIEGQVQDQTTGKIEKVASCAVVDSLENAFDLGAPYGFVMVDNTSGFDGTLRELMEKFTTGDYRRNCFYVSGKEQAGDSYASHDGQGLAPENGLNPRREIETFVEDRCNQMKADVTQKAIDAILDQRVWQGKFFIYAYFPHYEDITTSDCYIVMNPSSLPPPGYNDNDPDAKSPDGRRRVYQNANGSCSIQASSGWHNLFGAITFRKAGVIAQRN